MYVTEEKKMLILVLTKNFVCRHAIGPKHAGKLKSGPTKRLTIAALLH